MRAAFGFIDSLPEWSQSRKLLIVILTFLTMFLLALVGTAMAWAADTPMSLFERAMDYVFGGGSLGVGTQGVVDTMSARTGNYRAPVERASTGAAAVLPTPSAPPLAPAAAATGFAANLTGLTPAQPVAENASFRLPPTTLLSGLPDDS